MSHNPKILYLLVLVFIFCIAFSSIEVLGLQESQKSENHGSDNVFSQVTGDASRTANCFASRQRFSNA